MKYKPLAGRVIIRRDQIESVSEGGIVLPTENQRPKARGEVLATGPKATELNEGDRVVFQEHAGQRIDGEPKDILILLESDVIAVEL